MIEAVWTLCSSHNCSWVWCCFICGARVVRTSRGPSVAALVHLKAGFEEVEDEALTRILSIKVEVSCAVATGAVKMLLLS